MKRRSRKSGNGKTRISLLPGKQGEKWRGGGGAAVLQLILNFIEKVGERGAIGQEA